MWIAIISFVIIVILFKFKEFNIREEEERLDPTFNEDEMYEEEEEAEEDEVDYGDKKDRDFVPDSKRVVKASEEQIMILREVCLI